LASTIRLNVVYNVYSTIYSVLSKQCVVSISIPVTFTHGSLFRPHDFGCTISHLHDPSSRNPGCWGNWALQSAVRGDHRRTHDLVRPPPASAPHRRALPFNSHSQLACLLWYTSEGDRPCTSGQSLKAWYGAPCCLFGMPLHVDHLKGFVDHERVFDTEFCLSRRRFPAQHQH